MSVLRDILDEATMSFGDHLEELRRRIILAAAPALPLAVILFFFSDLFVRALVTPLRQVLESEGLPPTLQALAPPEVLLLKLKLSLILAAVLLAPWILWQTWLFIRPGLYGHERRFVRFLLPGSAVLTASGIALLYFVMLPLMLQVLVNVGADLDLGQGRPPVDARAQSVLNTRPSVELLTADPEDPVPGRTWLLLPELELRVAVADEEGAIEVVVVPRPLKAGITQDYRLSTYITFVLLLLVGIVIAFQMPLVIVLAGWVGLASADWLAAHRRYAIFICGIASALLTPADVVSMLVMLFPLYGLYELGILLLRIAPASAVAEGRVGRPKSEKAGASGASPADKRPSSADQPIEPAQPDSTLPRSATPAPPTEDAPPDQTD
ncbi:MAG: twin-arginine translocase subunit TatC [Planctomycetota bacterium]